MKRVKKVCVVTGTRAEYGLLKPVIKEIIAHHNLKLQLVVCGMHLQKGFGFTIKEIERDGFKIDSCVIMHENKSSDSTMAIAAGKGILGMTKAFSQLKPDVVLILGDRVEVLAAAATATYLNIPIAHIHGGDKTKGGTDESVRHAITKLSHLHFAATLDSGKRILRMGEEKKSIHVVGAPGIDTILQTKLMPRKKLSSALKMDLSKGYLLVIQHPVTSETELSSTHMERTLDAARTIGLPIIVIYPNSDTGSEEMISIIKKAEAESKTIRSFKSLPRDTFLSLMKHCEVMVGNSSAGIIETAPLDVPVVNIGIRENERLRSSNVIDVPHKKESIVRAIRYAMGPDFKKRATLAKNRYGDGNASSRIATILAKTDLFSTQKQITY